MDYVGSCRFPAIYFLRRRVIEVLGQTKRCMCQSMYGHSNVTDILGVYYHLLSVAADQRSSQTPEHVSKCFIEILTDLIFYPIMGESLVHEFLLLACQ